MTTPNAVHHIAISTADMKSQISFFSDVLGVVIVHSPLSDLLSLPSAGVLINRTALWTPSRSHLLCLEAIAKEQK